MIPLSLPAVQVWWKQFLLTRTWLFSESHVILRTWCNQYHLNQSNYSKFNWCLWPALLPKFGEYSPSWMRLIAFLMKVTWFYNRDVMIILNISLKWIGASDSSGILNLLTTVLWYGVTACSPNHLIRQWWHPQKKALQISLSLLDVSFILISILSTRALATKVKWSYHDDIMRIIQVSLNWISVLSVFSCCLSLVAKVLVDMEL